MSKTDKQEPKGKPDETKPVGDTQPSPPQPPPPKEEPKGKSKRVPRYPVGELAKKHGQTLKLTFPRKRIVPSAEHKAAAALHGWNDHQHHAGEPMSLTDEDYLEAIEAAKRPPQGTNKLRPHQPACSEHCPHAFMKATKKEN